MDVLRLSTAYTIVNEWNDCSEGATVKSEMCEIYGKSASQGNHPHLLTDGTV